jgi:hypothetical protein
MSRLLTKYKLQLIENMKLDGRDSQKTKGRVNQPIPPSIRPTHSAFNPELRRVDRIEGGRVGRDFIIEFYFDTTVIHVSKVIIQSKN